MLKFIALLFSVSVLALPRPKIYYIQSIYHTPPSSRVKFKVATNASGGINTKRFSHVGSTAPFGISRREAPIGFPR